MSGCVGHGRPPVPLSPGASSGSLIRWGCIIHQTASKWREDIHHCPPFILDPTDMAISQTHQYSVQAEGFHREMLASVDIVCYKPCCTKKNSLTAQVFILAIVLVIKVTFSPHSFRGMWVWEGRKEALPTLFLQSPTVFHFQFAFSFKKAVIHVRIYAKHKPMHISFYRFHCRGFVGIFAVSLDSSFIDFLKCLTCFAVILFLNHNNIIMCST